MKPQKVIHKMLLKRKDAVRASVGVDVLDEKFRCFLSAKEIGTQFHQELIQNVL